MIGVRSTNLDSLKRALNRCHLIEGCHGSDEVLCVAVRCSDRERVYFALRAADDGTVRVGGLCVEEMCARNCSLHCDAIVCRPKLDDGTLFTADPAMPMDVS